MQSDDWKQKEAEADGRQARQLPFFRRQTKLDHVFKRNVWLVPLTVCF